MESVLNFLLAVLDKLESGNFDYPNQKIHLIIEAKRKIEELKNSEKKFLKNSLNLLNL